MRATRYSLLSLGLCAALSALSISPSGGESQFGILDAQAAIVERVVAIVGEQAILLSDLKLRARPFLFRVYQTVPEGPQRTAAISQVYDVVLERMIEEELEEEAARKAGIVITSEEIDDGIARVASQNGITPAALVAEARKSGLTETQYRDELRRQLLQTRLVGGRLQGRVRVTESDLKGLYRRIQAEERLKVSTRLARLVIPLSGQAEADQAAFARAERLWERAQKGATLLSLMEEGPVGPGSGSGSVRPLSAEVEAVRRVGVTLELGQVSRPFRVGSDLFLLQVLERPETELPSYDEAREELYQRVYLEKMAKARGHFIASLRRRTHVEVRL